MSLAVAEKRPQQQNGVGCVGIFFQLLSKKKLFSKKLLPPPPAKKFGADDKIPMANLLLIGDENRGGFPLIEPDAGPDLENRMQAPGIVARLMGLESMPVVHNEKPTKALDSKFCGDSSFEHSRLDQGVCVDSGSNANGELRPQKLQETGGGFLERPPVEAFHKGLIYGSRKKQHMKLETPVKSPRLLSRSRTSRLVQVANKILEPGLQSRSRAKCAITYVGSLEDDREGDREQLSNSVSGSCKSCGNLVGVKESSAAQCGSSSSDLSSGSQESKRTKSPVIMNGQRKTGSVGIHSILKAKEVYKIKAPVVSSRQIENGSLAMQPKLNVESKALDLMEKKKDVGSIGDQYGKSVIRKNNLRQGQLLPAGVKVIPGSKICSVKQIEKNLNELNRAKNFVALNKNINNHTRSRSPAKLSGTGRYRGQLERDGWEKNLVRKRSPTNRNLEAFNSNFVKERSIRSNVMSRKGTGLISNQSINRSCTRSNLLEHDSFTESNNNGIVSFTFNSPMRCHSRATTHEEMAQERCGQGELKHNACHSRKLMSNAITGSLSSQKRMTLRGDKLSSLLEEKIRELSSLDGDELASGDDLQGRSTVSILEELISSLTMGTPDLHENGDICSNVSIQTGINVSHNQMRNTDEQLQEKAQAGILAAYLADGSEQPSPVSILEASFSNDNCSLGSFNGSSGSKPQLRLLEMCDNTQSSNMDSDLLDSATSLNICQSLKKTASMCEVGDAETELSTVDEAISDAELLFKNLSFYGSDRTLESSLDSFLLDTLDNIINVFCLNFIPAREGNQLREFMYDCIMECLQSKFSHCYKSGFRTWLKLPLILNRDQVMREVHAEISGWGDLAGKAMDDLVEKEMKGSNLKWTACESEAFEAGVEIQTDILQVLIEEMVIDLR